jgi:cysteine synthase
MRGVGALSLRVRTFVGAFSHFITDANPIFQGIGQGRITKNLGTFVNELSGALHIPDAKSIAMVYELLDSEGLYMGASSALNVVAAVELAQKLGPGKRYSISIHDIGLICYNLNRHNGRDTFV